MVFRCRDLPCLQFRELSPFLSQAKPEKEVLSPVDQEEQELKKKLEELTGNISDKGLSSDEDEANEMADDINSLGRSGHDCATVMGRNTAAIDKNSFFCKVPKVRPYERNITELLAL